MTGVDHQVYPELSDESCDVFGDRLKFFGAKRTSFKQLGSQLEARASLFVLQQSPAVALVTATEGDGDHYCGACVAGLGSESAGVETGAVSF